MLLKTEFDVVEDGEEAYGPCLRVEEDGIEGPVEYCRLLRPGPNGSELPKMSPE